MRPEKFTLFFLDLPGIMLNIQVLAVWRLHHSSTMKFKSRWPQLRETVPFKAHTRKRIFYIYIYIYISFLRVTYIKRWTNIISQRERFSIKALRSAPRSFSSQSLAHARVRFNLRVESGFISCCYASLRNPTIMHFNVTSRCVVQSASSRRDAPRVFIPLRAARREDSRISRGSYVRSIDIKYNREL